MAQVALMAVGTAITAIGQAKAAKAQARTLQNQAKAREQEAQHLEGEAGTQRAVYQRKAIEQRRRAAAMVSKARTGIAAGNTVGTGAEMLMLKLDQIGDYNTQSTLYEGERIAHGLELDADLKRQGAYYLRQEASDVRRAGKWKAFGTVIGGLGKGLAAYKAPALGGARSTLTGGYITSGSYT